MSKCKVIAVANQKGGVGKTTTTEHLGMLGSADFDHSGSVDFNHFQSIKNSQCIS